MFDRHKDASRKRPACGWQDSMFADARCCVTASSIVVPLSTRERG